MKKVRSRTLLVLVAFAVLIVPVIAFAAAGFDDVDSHSVFVADIQWMKDNGITNGCNPPANTNFCPDDPVTRQQMAAFMRRLAVNKVVDAATAVNTDTLDGAHASAFLGVNAKAADSDNLDGKDSTEFLTKSVYDTNDDSVVDSAEVKIRYSQTIRTVDMAASFADLMMCVTEPVTFGGTTTVVASGGLSLEPIGTSTTSINAYTYYRQSLEPSGSISPAWVSRPPPMMGLVTRPYRSMQSKHLPLGATFSPSDQPAVTTKRAATTTSGGAS